jgi:hypothetical protein
MRGEFRYADSCLLDRTRLRFFDRPSAEALLAVAGLHIVERLRVTRGLEETEVPVNLESTPPALVESALAGDDATTYQFVFVAADGRAAPSRLLPSLSERLQSRVLELEARCRDLELLAESNHDTQGRQTALIDDLTRRVDRGASQIAELTTELTNRMQELEARHRDVRSLRSDLALREDFLTRYRVEREQLVADAARLQQERDRLAREAQLAVERGLQASQAEARCVAATQAHTQLSAVHAALLDQHAQTVAAQAALRDEHTQLRDAHAALRAFSNSAGFRVVNAVSIRLRRFPRVYQILRSAVRGVARRAPRG